MSKIVSRLKEYIDLKGLSIAAFEKSIGMSNASFGRSLKNNGAIGTDKLENILNIYRDINLIWLLTGEGEMLKKNGNPESEKNAYLNAYPDAYLTGTHTHLSTCPDEINIEIGEKVTSETSHVHLIPFYDAIAVAGRKSVANMEAVTVPAEMINPGDWYIDATCAMRVYDESMVPEYRPGSVVALKEVYDKRLIIPGEDYVIETPEYRVIKRLQKADDKTCWLACSVNQEIWEQGPHKGKLIHEPFEIPIDLVRRIFLVLGEIRRKQCGNIFYT